jgi:RNA polymerase sigma-70 factor (ECF subfamily)
MTTALNLCRKEHRRRAQVRSGDVPEREVQFSSATLEMREALAELPSRQRQAVTLFYVGDLSVHAIAEVMNISDGAVKAHLSHGRKRLREVLDG